MLSKKPKSLVASSILLAVLAGGFLFSASTAWALGISPPWVKNHELLRGSHFEETVYINQGAPKESLKATLDLRVPEKIRSWITISPGTEFVIPITQLFPIKVSIDVPLDAELGDYSGEIKIKTQPAEQKEGQVTIGIGAAIALDFKVVEKEVIDFAIMGVKVNPMEERWPVKIAVTIVNRGNTKIKPHKVSLEVFSMTGSLLESGEIADLNYVEPFQTQESIAEFPINLGVGLHWAMVKVYKTEGEVFDYKIPFEVLPEGTLPRPGKGLAFWFLVGLGAMAVAALVGAIIKFRLKILAVLIRIIQPFAKIKRKFKRVLRVLREKEEEQNY